jgi:hypothetical protein
MWIFFRNRLFYTHYFPSKRSLNHTNLPLMMLNLLILQQYGAVKIYFFCTKNHVVQVQLNKTHKNKKKIIYYKLVNIWFKNTIWIQDLPWAYNQLITVQKTNIIRGYHWIVWCINHAGLSNQEGHIWRDLSLTGPICVCCLWSWKQNNISGPNITLSLFPSRVAVGLHL